MRVADLLAVLNRAPSDARIVLKLSNGDEVELVEAAHHCQLVVLTADVPEPEPARNTCPCGCEDCDE